jgi:DNA-binding XRE family transcriptional regulator
MNKKCKSIYQLARNYAGFTQKETAEKLNLAIRTLKRHS